MKKFLIALPLVLIMILSMIPVMAAEDVQISVPIKYYSKPDMKEVLREETRTILVSKETAENKALLAKAVKEQVIAFGFPKLDTDNQPAWEVVVDVDAMTSTAEKKVVKQNAKENLELATLQAEIKDYGFEVTTSEVTTDKVLSQTGVNKVNAEIEKVANDKKPADVVLAGDDFTEKPVKGEDDQNEPAPVKVDLSYISVTPATGTAATASAKAYPKCIVDPAAKPEKVCPTLCERIKIVAKDVVTGEIINGRQYGVNNKQMPNYDAMMKHFSANYIPHNAYTIASNWFGAPAIDYPSVVDSDCTITILLLPKFVRVNVIHELYNCCKEIDGKVNYQLYKTFVEKDQVVEFFDYHTKLMVDNSKAAEFAQTRLQKINAMDFVFIKAIFDDGIRLDQYMNGDVYDLDGNLIKRETVTNQLPTIKLIYHRAECVEKTEEKVDNATVENNNATTAPATNSGTQLPATGAKDVTAFFLSAVALLGLGIFFAKKH